MPPDSPSGSRLRRSKLAWSCSEVWLRPRETNQGKFCRERFAGSLTPLKTSRKFASLRASYFPAGEETLVPKRYE